MEIMIEVVPVLEGGARVLMNDFVLPRPGELGLLEERRSRRGARGEAFLRRVAPHE